MRHSKRLALIYAQPPRGHWRWVQWEKEQNRRCYLRKCKLIPGVSYSKERCLRAYWADVGPNCSVSLFHRLFRCSDKWIYEHAQRCSVDPTPFIPGAMEMFNRQIAIRRGLDHSYDWANSFCQEGN